MSQIRNFMDPEQVMPFIRENFSKIFPGGDLANPNSPIRQMLDPVLENIRQGVSAGDSYETITSDAFGDYFPDAYAFTALLFKSYCTIDISGVAYAVLGESCKPNPRPHITLVIPCAIAQDVSNMHIEFGDPGNGGYNTQARLVLQKKTRRSGAVENMFEVSDVGNEGEGSAGYYINAREGLTSQITATFGTMADGCYFNIDNNKTTLDDGGLDCRYLTTAGDNARSNFQVINNGNIGVSFSVDENGQLADPGADTSLRYGVLYSVNFGENGPTPRVSFTVLSEGDAFAEFAWDLNPECGGEFSPSLDYGHFENGDADDFFQSLEEAHEAYPDLFPLDTVVGLSATRKHFIRIS